MIVIGVPSLDSLNKVLEKLKANQVPHYAWIEPDYDFGFTAIAAGPLDESQKKVLSNYRLWSHHSPVVQLQNIVPLKREVQVRVLPGEPNACLAQSPQEHSVL
jgi:hypothetical protein